MKIFKHTHLSTRYDRSTDSLRRVVASYIKDRASIITLTEVDNEKREKVIRGFDGWGSVTGDKTGRDDCAIMWNEEEWNVLHKETINVAEYTKGNIGAAIAVLEHKSTGSAIVVSVIHLPSAVEGQGRVVGGRADEWYQARRIWVRRVKQLRRRFNAVAMILIADWNIDLKKKWVQTLIKTLHRGWKFAWALSELPVGGTHGHRLIDFSLYKGKLKMNRRPRIHRSTDASDHKGYDETFAFDD